MPPPKVDTQKPRIPPTPVAPPTPPPALEQKKPAADAKKTADTARREAAKAQAQALRDAKKARDAEQVNKEAQKEKAEAEKALEKVRKSRESVSPRQGEQAQRPADSTRLPPSDERVRDAEDRVSRATARAAETSQDARDGLERAETSLRVALEKADTALSAQKTANASAKQAGQPEPFPKANEVRDVYDAGSLSKKDQQKLLGASVPVTPEEAARADVRHIDDAVKNAKHSNEGPVAGAEELRKQLALNPDPAYRAALWKETKPQRDAFVNAQVNDRSLHHSKKPELMKSLAQGADMAGQGARKELATQLLSASKSKSLDGVGEPGRSLKENAKDPAVAKLGGEMVQQLRAAKRYQAADSLSNLDPAIKTQSKPSKLDQELQSEVALNSVSAERDGLNARQKLLDQETRTTARQTLDDIAKNPKSKAPFNVEPGATKDHAVLVRKDKDGKVTERLELSFQGDKVKVDSTKVDKSGEARRSIFESEEPGGPSTAIDARWKQDAAAPPPSREELAEGKVKGASYAETKFQVGPSASQTTTQRAPDGSLTETKKTFSQINKGDHVTGRFGEFMETVPSDKMDVTTTVIPPPGAKDEQGKPAKATVTESSSYSQGDRLRLTRTSTKAVDCPAKADRPAGAKELEKVRKESIQADDAAPRSYVLEKAGDGELNTQTFFEGQPNVTLVTRKKLEGNTVTETTEGRLPKPAQKGEDVELVDVKSTTTRTYNNQGLITASHSDQTDVTGIRRVKDFQRTETRNAKGEVEVTERTTGSEEGGGKPKRTYEQSLTTAQTPKEPQVVHAQSKLTGPEGTAEASIPPERVMVNGKSFDGPNQLKQDLPPAQAALGAYAVNGLQNELNHFTQLSALHTQALKDTPEAPESEGMGVAGDASEYGLARLAKEANSRAANAQGKPDPADNPKFFSLKPEDAFKQELTLNLNRNERLSVGMVGGFQVAAGINDIVSGVGDFKKALDEQNLLSFKGARELATAGADVLGGAVGVVEGVGLMRFAAKGSGTTISPSGLPGPLNGRVNPIKFAEWSGRLNAAVGVISGGLSVAEGISKDDTYQVALGAVQAGGALAGYFGTAAAAGALGGPAGVAVALSVGMVTIGVGSVIERERAHALAEQRI